MAGHKKVHSSKERKRIRRKHQIRHRISGTETKPRLSVFRSNSHIYLQAVDDVNNVVLAAASDLDKDVKAAVEGKKKAERAKAVGEALGRQLLEKKITSAVFDRNGFIYHGRVKQAAEGAREAGLKF